MSEKGQRFQSFAERYVIARAPGFRLGLERDDAQSALHDAISIFANIEVAMITSTAVAARSDAPLETADDVPPPGWVVINSHSNLCLFKLLLSAIRKDGRLPPSGVGAPNGVLCVTVQDWHQVVFADLTAETIESVIIHQRIKSRLFRACRAWSDEEGGKGIIGKDGEWVWRTERRVFKVDVQ